MKDEELLAEEYICNGKCQDDLTKNYVHCKTCTRIKDFLAGLKVGRPQWHTPDVPTSPINKVVLGYIKDYNSKKFCLVKWNGEWWYDARTWNDKVKLIAWCELPTFDKE